jgi:hypothetical protein
MKQRSLLYLLRSSRISIRVEASVFSEVEFPDTFASHFQIGSLCCSHLSDFLSLPLSPHHREPSSPFRPVPAPDVTLADQLRPKNHGQVIAAGCGGDALRLPNELCPTLTILQTYDVHMLDTWRTYTLLELTSSHLIIRGSRQCPCSQGANQQVKMPKLTWNQRGWL